MRGWLQPIEHQKALSEMLKVAGVGQPVPRRFSAWLELQAGHDLVKAHTGSDAKRGPFKGIASTEKRDDDGEVVRQSGIDWSGADWITLEHPLGVVNLIGEPTAFEPSTCAGYPSTDVCGDFFLNRPLGRETFDTALSLRDVGAKKKLGLSVEGDALEVHPDDDADVLKSKVYSIAVSPTPKNPFTRFDAIMMSVAGAIGYPLQGVNYTSGGLPAAVPQDGVSGTVRRGRVVSVDDAGVLTVLKHLPHLNFKDATDVFRSLTAILDRKKKRSPKL